MKYIFTYSVIVAVMTALLIPPHAGHAATPKETAIPKDIQGNWSLPDCRRQEQIMVYGDGYILKIMPEFVSLYETATTGKGEGYYILKINDAEEIAVSLSSDGLMDVGYPAAGEKIPSGEVWDDLSFDRNEEYSHCIEILNARHQPGFGAMTHLSAVLGSCSDPGSKNCAAALFSATDTNDDKKLTQEEMLRGGLMLTYITEAAESETVPQTALETAMKTARTEIKALATDLMNRLDADKSKSLTLAEFNDPAALTTGAHAAYFDALMKRAKNLFPWLGRFSKP